jgi:hypothetical protein
MTRVGQGRSWRGGLLVGVSSVFTGLVVGAVLNHVRGNRMAPWILGRASGVTAYLLLVALVALGITLSHPARPLRGRTAIRRMRAHVTLALLALAAAVLHIVILATDRYAGVGWVGTLLPMRADYRPIPVTFGVLGFWIGLLAGVSAALAGHLPLRMWFPLHRVATVSFLLVLGHGFWAGSDTTGLSVLYAASGALVLALATGRYLAKRRDVPA